MRRLLLLCLVGCVTERTAKTHPRDSSGESPTAVVAPPESTAPAVVAHDSAPALASWSPDDADIVFQSADAEKAFLAYTNKDYAAARPLLQALASREPALAGFARLLAGLSADALSNYRDALPDYEFSRQALPTIADLINYREARALYFLGRHAEADARAAAVGNDSIATMDARLLRGDIVRARGTAADIEAHYRAYLADFPRGIRRTEAMHWLASALWNGTAKQKDEAKTLWRRIRVTDPLSKWADEARTRTPELQSKAAVGIRLTGPEHIERGLALFSAQRNTESETAFAASLATGTLSAADQCIAAFHLAQSQFKARNRVAASLSFDAALPRCTVAGNQDLRVRSAYQAGRAYAYLDQHQTALARYQAAETMATAMTPPSSLGDDALLRQAEEWESLGNVEEMQKALAALPARFPDGDMRAEALWRLGFAAWRSGDTATAIKWWQQQISAVPLDDNYWAEGQAQYWLGRAYVAVGKRDEALAAYREVLRLYPLGYYALLAINRMRELDPAAYPALIAGLRADPGVPPLRIIDLPQWHTPGFERALTYLRAGLGAQANAELRALGLVPPSDRGRLTDQAAIDALWAIAMLYDRAGSYPQSVWATRWQLLDYRRNWPAGHAAARWKIAYPRGYSSLITEHAKKNGALPAMLFAIVREESGFEPTLESYANAIGLTQMIMPTASRFAKGTGLAPTRALLQEPEANITIGSRFLGFLFSEWKNHLSLVPTSYNAGEGAVRRMLAARGTLAADEFTEAIIDDQARNYTKRVLGSFFVYSWLYDNIVPVMPVSIPAELLPSPRT